MISSTIDTEIFDLLDRADFRITEPAKNLVAHFQFDDDLFFLLYFPGKKFRICYLFRLDGKNIAGEVRRELIPYLIGLPEENGFDEVKTRALVLAEQLMVNDRDEAAFFDAH